MEKKSKERQRDLEVVFNTPLLQQRALLVRGEKEPASGSRCTPYGRDLRNGRSRRRRFIAGLGGAMKGRALSTGCPGLYLYAVKDSRVPPEIDLIYVGPFSATD